MVDMMMMMMMTTKTTMMRSGVYLGDRTDRDKYDKRLAADRPPPQAPTTVLAGEDRVWGGREGSR